MDIRQIINASLVRNVGDVVNNEYFEYSMYTINSRAIPSVVDGLKRVQRKALYTATKEAVNKKVKTAALGGMAIAMTDYAHGDVSMNDAITKMAATFSNNWPLLDKEGSFGSRLVPTAASPRYTYVKLSKTFKTIFKDNEVLTPEPDPDSPEPLYYLPIIPMLLVNGSSGIATGFACDVPLYDPDQITQLCYDYLNGKDISNELLMPKYPDFNGTFEYLDDKLVCHGLLRNISPTEYIVNEVPIGFTREKYIEILNKLVDSNKIAKYEDKCNKEGFKFVITMKRGHSYSHDQIYRMLKLSKTIKVNLTAINEHGSLQVFDSPIDIIKQFCDFRITKVQDRIEYNINKLNGEIERNRHKVNFIKAFINGDLTIKNVSKAQLKRQIPKLNLGIPADMYDTLIGMPIYNLTTDNVRKLESEYKTLTSTLKQWKKASAKTEYSNDLQTLLDGRDK